MSRKRTAVIIGTGLAGVSAADTLRADGFDGRIVLIGEEPGAPYDRPPLTKAYLRGEVTAGDVRLRPSSFYSDQEIDLIAGTAVVSLDVDAAEVRTADGSRLAYDAALIATGAAPQQLPVPGARLPGVHVLRTIGDADELVRDSAEAARVVVIGAGWIGAEAAASLRQMNKDVTIVAPEAVMLERALGPIGSVFSRLHSDHGVDLRLRRGVAEIRGHKRAEAVVTDDGRAIACDLVLVGIGAVPRDELAVTAGLNCTMGVFTDRWLRTNARDVYAAGDVAIHAHPRYGHLRVDHWANARDQGAAAARSMLGNQDAFDRIPSFFSDQYDLGLEYVGRASPVAELVIRGDVQSREFIAFWHDRGRIVAGMNVNVWDVVQDIEALINSQVPVDLEELVDPSVPLGSLLGEKRVA